MSEAFRERTASAGETSDHSQGQDYQPGRPGFSPDVYESVRVQEWEVVSVRVHKTLHNRLGNCLTN